MTDDERRAVERLELSTVAACDGCGVCCMHMASPPYDSAEVRALPNHVRSDYEAAMDSRELQMKVHGTDFIPCGFFDMVTRKCRHHEHRPDICRDFDLAGESCGQFRIDAGLIAFPLFVESEAPNGK